MPCIYEWIRTWNALERKRNTRKLLTEHLLHKVDDVLRVYGSDVISVDYNEVTGMIDINYCGGSFSDGVFQNLVDYDQIDKSLLVKELDRRRVGYCLR